MMYRDLMTYGIEGEATYQDALNTGVKFLKFAAGKAPESHIHTRWSHCFCS